LISVDRGSNQAQVIIHITNLKQTRINCGKAWEHVFLAYGLPQELKVQRAKTLSEATHHRNTIKTNTDRECM
jgi:hypothetical protein